MSSWIMAFFGDSLALLIYASIFLAGSTFSFISLVFGGDADHDADVDVSADDADVGDDVHDVHAPGVVSVGGLFLMLTGFGGVGYILQYYTERILFSALGGLMSGWLFAALLMAVLRAFYKQQASSQIRVNEIVGSHGIVTVTIPGGNSLGEVQLSVYDTQMNRPATSSASESIPRGARVKVRSYLGGTVVVEKV